MMKYEQLQQNATLEKKNEFLKKLTVTSVINMWGNMILKEESNSLTIIAIL